MRDADDDDVVFFKGDFMEEVGNLLLDKVIDRATTVKDALVNLNLVLKTLILGVAMEPKIHRVQNWEVGNLKRFSDHWAVRVGGAYISEMEQEQTILPIMAISKVDMVVVVGYVVKMEAIVRFKDLDNKQLLNVPIDPKV